MAAGRFEPTGFGSTLLRLTMEHLIDDDARPRAWPATFAGADPFVRAGSGR
jgi:hypothetical protein